MYPQRTISELLDSERRLREILQEQPLAVVGLQIKAHRQRCQMTVRELAARAMVSKTSVVNLEHGRSCNPATLAKLCAALGLHLDRLGEPTRKTEAPLVQRANQHLWYDLNDPAAEPLSAHSLTAQQRSDLRTVDRNAFMAMFRNVPPDSAILAGMIEVTLKTEDRQHPGSELLFVLEGAVKLDVQGKTFELGKGDCVYIPAASLHSYESATTAPVLLLVIRIG
ncbi:MAG TPA: XRE family transcriptional regulator [Fimbriimonadaceae bacterium]|jgi:mannose-6-phosphate isomerase-like protein (cupin superfamily)/DNA-binding Xre family transcriptional regulator